MTVPAASTVGDANEAEMMTALLTGVLFHTLRHDMDSFIRQPSTWEICRPGLITFVLASGMHARVTLAIEPVATTPGGPPPP